MLEMGLLRAQDRIVNARYGIVSCLRQDCCMPEMGLLHAGDGIGACLVSLSSAFLMSTLDSAASLL